MICQQRSQQPLLQHCSSLSEACIKGFLKRICFVLFVFFYNYFIIFFILLPEKGTQHLLHASRQPFLSRHGTVLLDLALMSSQQFLPDSDRLGQALMQNTLVYHQIFLSWGAANKKSAIRDPEW